MRHPRRSTVSKDKQSYTVVTNHKGEAKVPLADIATAREMIATKGELSGEIGLISLQDKNVIEIKLYPRRNPQVPLSPPAAIPGARWMPPPIWQPEPTLVIGLGGTGRHVLTHLKKNLLDAGSGELPGSVKLILLDTSDYELLNDQKVPVSFAGVSLASEDVAEFGEDLRPLMEALVENPDQEPEISQWFPAREYNATLAYDELNLSHGTRQHRPPVRAALIKDLQKGIGLQGVNVILLVDHSSSMAGAFSAESESITKLEAAQRAACLFVDQLDLSVDRVAVVKFDQNATALCSFNQDRNEIKSAINHIGIGDQTAIHVGLKESEDLLDAHTTEAGRNVVILLTDGESSFADAQRAAQALTKKGNTLIAVGIGDANESLLRSIASMSNEKPQYYYANSTQELAKIYINLGREIGEGSKIWRLIHGAVRNCLNDDELRVILVGSLAGGFGSSMVADLAYLARRAGRSVGAKSISVEAYLATSGVFSGVSAREEINAVNTFASLREIDRFQLAQGFPFRMIYKMGTEGKQKSVLAGNIDWRLLDEIYLFDRLPTVKTGSASRLDERSPVAGVFPVMADAITLWLDKAARTGGLGDYRRDILGFIGEEHRIHGHAAVGSLGLFVYRLPMRDLIDVLKARWARELIYMMLIGDTAGQLRVDVALNQEEDPEEVSTHVMQFLLGASGYQELACPASTAMIGRLAYEGALPDLQDQYDQAPIVDMQAESTAFQAYLSSAVITMLNGLQSSQVLTARSGKLGYVLLFLDTLKADLDQAATKLENKIPVLGDLIVRYRAHIQAVKQNLTRQMGYLTQHLSLEGEKKPGIYERLEALEVDCLKRIDEIGGILTRRYIYFDGLLERWYGAYFSDPEFRKEALSRLFWTLDPGGNVTLTLRSWGSFILGFDPVSIQSFINELLRLAGYAGRELLERETLASVLKETTFSPEQLPKTAENLREGSLPLLTYKHEYANNAKYLMLMGVNPSVECREELERLVSKDLPGKSMFRSIEITDPFSLVVAQLIDVIPLNALQSIDHLKTTYQTWYGLTAGRRAEVRSEPTAIFHAEKMALSLEQRLPTEVKQTSRLLRPIIVSALDQEPAARQYALALSAGWVKYLDEKIKIMLPDGTVLMQITPAMSLVSPYVEGFVLFSARALPSQIDALETAIKEAGPEALAAWREWTVNDWQTKHMPQILQASGPEGADLASITAIITRDEVRRRVTGLKT